MEIIEQVLLYKKNIMEIFLYSKIFFFVRSIWSPFPTSEALGYRQPTDLARPPLINCIIQL